MLQLSIITTLYKSAGYMDKCLETLLDQDIPENEYEIILVNDGSPDNSLEIAERYASKHPNIHVVSYEVNRGLAGARQAGTDEAQGKYLCYVDPDDYIKKSSFSKLIQQMEHDNLDMLRFNYQMVDEDYHPISKPQDARIVDYSPKIMDGPSFLADRLGYGCFVWAFIYRSSLIKDSGVKFRQGDYFDDTAWLPQIIRHASRIDTIPEIRYYYLQRSNSLVNTVSNNSIIKKLDAELAVIERLKDQMKTADPLSMKWYRGMNSKLALSILSTAAVSVPDLYNQYLNKIKALDTFPLSCPNASKTQKLKISLLNISPMLFSLLLKYKNK